VSSDTCSASANSVIPHQKRRPIKITTDTNEFQIGMSRRKTITATKNDFEKNLRDPKRKIKTKNEGPQTNNAI